VTSRIAASHDKSPKVRGVSPSFKCKLSTDRKVGPLPTLIHASCTSSLERSRPTPSPTSTWIHSISYHVGTLLRGIHAIFGEFEVV
jgi:hypothetical protein